MSIAYDIRVPKNLILKLDTPPILLRRPARPDMEDEFLAPCQ